MNNTNKLILGLTASLAMVAAAASPSHSASFGPSAGEREFSIAGTGSNDRNFDSGNFGLVLEHGWYVRDHVVWGIRQSVNYANIQGESFEDDFWNGATRAYMDYQFGSERARPFVGGSLGYIYGDGVNDSGFAGAEFGVKYYVLTNTYILGRVEYQWYFDSDSDADEAFKDGSYSHTLGIGYNF